MQLQIHNTHTDIIFDNDDECLLILEALTIRFRYYVKQRGARRGEWKERSVEYLHNHKGRFYFPTGLASRVARKAIECSMTIDIEDKRDRSFFSITKPIKLTLPSLPITTADYSFQEKAVEDAVKAERGLMHYPTGAGKTVIIARIINKLQLNSLIVVPNLTLLEQTYKKFIEYFGEEAVGKLGDSKVVNVDAPIIIATQQTLWSMLKAQREQRISANGLSFSKFVSIFNCLFVDECHHVAVGSLNSFNKKTGEWEKKEDVSNTWWEVALNIPAFYRFGMSATLNTPDSPNNQFVLESVTGRVISAISVTELIKRNVLCPAKVTMYRMVQPKYSIWQTSYWWEEDAEGKPVKVGVKEAGAYQYNITENETRNKFIADLVNRARAEGRRILVLVDLVETQGKALEKLIPGVVFLYGGKSKKEREVGLQLVRDEKRPLMGTIFGEGFDMPAVDTVVIANGGKSYKKVVQQIGRGLRVSPGKFEVQVFDIFDDDGSMCAKHSQARLDIYQSEDRYEVEVIDYEEFIRKDSITGKTEKEKETVDTW